ncbi:MAG TPA: hypothetical protein ENN19_12270 [Chloroflexi bacterium]|nr:hypothetical protein [Chloroflexota bacterium]
MKLKQKRILIALAMLNVIALVGLMILIRKSPSLPNPSTRQLPSAIIDLKTCPAISSTDETWEATQLLAQLGLGGRVALHADSVLRFEIPYSTAPDPVTPATIDEAAQSAWRAFDVAQALLEQAHDCVPFTDVQVTIVVRGGWPHPQPEAQLDVHVQAADLLAFNVGELSEEAFIERVTYTVRPIGRSP